MMYRLLHVSIAPAYGVVNKAEIENRLNDLGRDWLRYNSLSWILWTNKSTITVSEMLSGHIQPADFLLVLALSTNELPTGRLAEWMWDWINRPRDSLTGEVRTPMLPAPAAENLWDVSGSWLLPPSGPGKPELK